MQLTYWSRCPGTQRIVSQPPKRNPGKILWGRVVDARLRCLIGDVWARVQIMAQPGVGPASYHLHLPGQIIAGALSGVLGFGHAA